MRNFATLAVAIFIILTASMGESKSKNSKHEKRQPQNILGDIADGVTGLFAGEAKDEARMALERKLIDDAVIRRLQAGSTEDYFQDMDYGITRPENIEATASHLRVFLPNLSAEEAKKSLAKGRNNWIVWSGGNDRFWTEFTKLTLGSTDLLKIISNYPKSSNLAAYPFSRDNRWLELGLINEPCFAKTGTYSKANLALKDPWGLYLDERDPACTKADPFANATNYPGIKIGSRGSVLRYRNQKIKFDVGSFYGRPTGIVGLRLFNNPDFDQKAADAWDPERYYTDPVYYMNPNLIRPYRVGMSCAFCHIGPNPALPPKDFNAPTWANLNGNAGAQYFWTSRIFNWNYKNTEDNFIGQLFKSSRPGALDTSIVSSDNINNPRTMNAVYDLPARAVVAKAFGHFENLKGEELKNNQLNNAPIVGPQSVLRSFYDPQKALVISPRVLKDGADSVGVLGALNRVYVNIGLFSEHWLQNFRPVIGGEKIKPFQIALAETNSEYWKANVQQTQDLAVYLMAASRPDKLETALKNSPTPTVSLLSLESPEVLQGKKIFAQNCAACHSSKQPPEAFGIFNDPKNPNKCTGENYLNCWNAYAQYVKTPTYKEAIQNIVLSPDFLHDNYLSTEHRVPANVLEINLCSPMATNAIKGNIWDNFSSSSYKTLSPIGEFQVQYPRKLSLDHRTADDMTSETLSPSGGGRGYIRPASLISIWASAPFLQNNSVGRVNYSGTVAGRMESFEDSIRKMLNPETRGQAPLKNEHTVKYTSRSGVPLTGFIDVTTQTSFLKIPVSFLPALLKDALQRASAANNAKWEVQGDSWVLKMNKAWDPKTFVSTLESFKKSKRAVAEFSPPVANVLDPTKATMIQIGPIPQGVPVNLISNLDLNKSAFELDAAGLLPESIGDAYDHLSSAVKGPFLIFDAVMKMSLATSQINLLGKKDQEALDIFMETAAPALLAASTCKDFVVNRGHYFGSRQFNPNISLDDQNALIEYLKHF